MLNAANSLAAGQEDVYEKEIMQDNSEENSNQKKGRPRSEKSRKAILKATNALLLHTSVQDLSIEAIAKKAKVGKTTIYRWWPNKTSVVMDALMSQPGLQKPMPTPSNNAEAIRMQMEKLIHLLDSKNGQIIAQLFSEAQSDEKSQEIFDQNFLSPLIDAMQYSVEQGQEDGEFSKKLDSRIVVDMLCGPIFFRLMSHSQDLDKDFSENFTQDIVRLISA